MEQCAHRQDEIKIAMVRFVAKPKHTDPTTQKATGKGEEMERVFGDAPPIVFALTFVEAVKEKGDNAKREQPSWIASQPRILKDPVAQPDHENGEQKVDETFHKPCKN